MQATATARTGQVRSGEERQEQGGRAAGEGGRDGLRGALRRAPGLDAQQALVAPPEAAPGPPGEAAPAPPAQAPAPAGSVPEHLAAARGAAADPARREEGLAHLRAALGRMRAEAATRLAIAETVRDGNHRAGARETALPGAGVAGRRDGVGAELGAARIGLMAGLARLENLEGYLGARGAVGLDALSDALDANYQGWYRRLVLAGEVERATDQKVVSGDLVRAQHEEAARGAQAIRDQLKAVARTIFNVGLAAPLGKLLGEEAVPVLEAAFDAWLETADRVVGDGLVLEGRLMSRAEVARVFMGNVQRALATGVGAEVRDRVAKAVGGRLPLPPALLALADRVGGSGDAEAAVRAGIRDAWEATRYQRAPTAEELEAAIGARVAALAGAGGGWEDPAYAARVARLGRSLVGELLRIDLSRQ